MQKRGFILGFFSFIFGINLVSAFSLSNFLYFVEPSTIILGTIFIISFALINLALSRTLRGNAAVSAIVSLSMSLLIIYGINRFNWDYEGFFLNIGFSSEILYMVMPAVLLGLIILLWMKGKLGITLAGFGAFLIGIASFTDLVVEKGVTNTIGGVLLVLGIWLWLRKRRKERGLLGTGDSAWERGKGQYQRAKEYVDPRNKLERYNLKKQEVIGKRLAREELEKQKQIEQAHGEALKENKKRAASQQAQQAIRQQTVRTQKELQGKYDQHRYAAQAIVKRVGNHIPKKGTPEYLEWKRNTQAVKAVENIAKKQGIRLR